MIYAVIPAKHFEGAKQRLSTLLKPHDRIQLARAMLTDTLTACCQDEGLDGVGVVTHHEAPAEIAAALGAEVWWEPEAGGHSQAVAFGVHTCLQRGIDTMLTLPGDIPLVTPADIAAMVRVAVSDAPVVLAPNRDELGTNAMRLSPPDCLPLAFGHDSFQRHLSLAAERQLAVDIRRLPRLALDIDEPEDLAFFAAHRKAGHSLDVLVGLGLLERLASIPVPPLYELKR